MAGAVATKGEDAQLTRDDVEGDTGTGVIEHPESKLLTRAQAMGLELQSIIEAVPEAGDEGELNILRQVFSAQSIHDLDRPWNTDGLETFDGHLLVVDAIRRMPSSFADGLGWFLVVDAFDRTSNKNVTITTGSVSVVAQLVKAHALAAFPLQVVPRKAVRPSKRGYFPMHLEIAHIDER